MFSAADHRFMARALRLAYRGLYTTTPNPRVGCVLVNNGIILGEGWHEKAGEAHAEIRALQDACASQSVRGATAYVTLEPCNHFGRTPPCAEALIETGIARVVIAMRDPNPQVAGQGQARLAAAGIVTECGLMETEARELNPGFIARMTRGRPWLRVKLAASLDGRTALNNGKSQWITSEPARQDGHRWRARACAILTGIGTVKKDNPRLTVRDVNDGNASLPLRQPLKVVVDSRLEILPEARLLKLENAGGENVLIATAVADETRIAALNKCGAEVIVLPDVSGRVDLGALMRELARRGLNEIHAEAGAKLNGALLRAGLADEILLYLAPTLLGDSARGMFALPELADLADRHDLEIADLRRIGNDIRIRALLRAGDGS